jgi:eukaryotic-like serine/threonine-protein kinase
VPADRWPTAQEFAAALGAAEARPAHARLRVPVPALALGLGFLLGAGLLFAWRAKFGGVASETGPIRLAVLPFDNLGDTADAYFADGVTDAVRGKLTDLPGLEVIGSASSAQYRHSTKAPRQIAQELGVRYLLVGKVRWAKGPGTSRVQVSPELVDVSTLADKWEAPFDAPLTDVFQVQGDIAGKVAAALKVALTPAKHQALSDKPTENLAAYDAYLRGIDIRRHGNTPRNLRQAIKEFSAAVAQDSAFALAWAKLGGTESLLYYNESTTATPALADSADRATARGLELAPELPAAHEERARYYQAVRTDIARARAEIDTALTRSPNSPEILMTAAGVEEFAGQWPAALAHAQQGVRLDPRTAAAAGRTCEIAIRMRIYDVADQGCTLAVALAPNNLAIAETNVMRVLGRGRLDSAQRIIRNLPATIDQSDVVAFFSQFWDLYWVLDSAQETRLLSLRPEAFDDNRPSWAFVLAEMYDLRGDRAHARIYADTARAGFEAQVKVNPNDDEQRMLLGLSYAYLGRTSDAIREGERGVAIRPPTLDARGGPYNQELLARIYLLVGKPEQALDILEALLAKPFFITSAWLRIDPTWAALRGNPRFERLRAIP